MYFKYLFLIISYALTPVAAQMRLEDQKMAYTVTIINNFADFYKFDNLIIYRMQNNAEFKSLKLSLHDEVKFMSQISRKGSARIFSKHGLTPIMVFTVDNHRTTYYANDTTDIPNLSNLLTNRNLAIVLLPDLYNKKLKELVAISLGASIETKIVFLLAGPELTGIPDINCLQKMQDFFRWCWAKNLLNVLLVFQKDFVANLSDLTMEIYTYTPFPVPVKMINLTSVQDKSQYFKQKTSDVQGYELKTPVLQDKPHVFKVTNTKSGKNIVTGTIGRLYVEFVNKINGTFVEIPNEYTYFWNASIVKHMLKFMKEGLVDIGIHPFSFIVTKSINGSYPMTNTNSCVILPVIPEIDRAYYIPYTFNVTIWLSILLTFILYVILHMFGYYQRFQRVNPDVAFGVTLTGMLNLPTSFRLQDNLNNGMITQRLVQISLTITGLIFTQMYVTSLTSLLSTTIYGQQLETVEDLRAANITLMLSERQYLIYMRSNVLPSNFSANVIIRDGETISSQLASMNTSFGYVVFQEEWKAMRRLQASLWKPVFRIASKLCIPNVYLVLPAKFNSPFYEPLKLFTLWAQAGGLDNKWSDMVYSDIQLSSGIKHEMDNAEHPASITLEHLTILWYIWAGGILLAVGVICVELCSKKK